ncbi:hypothetical protein V6N11_036180 [Hibiscus sabdariffa]|uniref:Uncharacterized protein n=1 Tax=Hibiscus sabdariffa TaxID=183260 RepID=A0ABR2R9Z4_9ROSI
MESYTYIPSNLRIWPNSLAAIPHGSFVYALSHKEGHQKSSKSHYRTDGDGGGSEVRLLGPDGGIGTPFGNISNGDEGGSEVRLLGPDREIGTPFDKVPTLNFLSDADARILLEGEPI